MVGRNLSKTKMDARIKHQVEKAMAKIQHLFEANKSVLLQDQDHAYMDKYNVVQFVADQTVSELDLILKEFNVDIKRDNRVPVLFLFNFQETCVFKKKVETKVPLSTLITKRISGIFNHSSQKQVFEVVTEYLWDFVLEFKFCLQVGHVELVLEHGEINHEFRTTSDINPRLNNGNPTKTFQCNPFEYFEYSSFSGGKRLEINRQDPDCYTPRRNTEIEGLIKCYQRIESFCNEVGEFVSLYPEELFNQEFDLRNAIGELSISSTVVPIFTQQLIVEPLQNYFSQNLKSNLDSILSKCKNSSLKPISKVLVLFAHMATTIGNFVDGVDYVESLLVQQLVDAVGREVTIRDMEDYMIFHNRQILKIEYQPKPVSIDIRHTGYTPEGTVQIEIGRSNETSLLFSVTRVISDAPDISFDLNSSTSVTLSGRHYVHASVAQKYSTEVNPAYTLTSRARQFSCFILLVGTMIDNTKFEMKNAFIVQNKDDLKIPLLLETIPTAQQFRDAIKSMSPNQQRFAKSIRAMQLQSTLFAFCIIQIKPALEKILNLPPGSLTKEIQLTQDLLKLFIDFQIPADMMKFEGDALLPVKQMVSQVKSNTDSVLGMINEAKEKEVASKLKLAELAQKEKELMVTAKLYSPKKKVKATGVIKPVPVKMKRAMLKAGVPRREQERQRDECDYEACDYENDQPVAQDTDIASDDMPELASAVEEHVESNPNERQRNSNLAMKEKEGGPALLSYTSIPTTLESSFDLLKCGGIRPTIIKPAPYITKTEQPGLLGPPNTIQLNSSIDPKALYLLDALSRSGDLAMDESSLHIVIVSTQCFDETLINQVIRKDCNPIDLIERSTLVLAKTIHGKDVHDLLVPNALGKVKKTSPDLFE